MSVKSWIPLALLVLSCATGGAEDFFDRYFKARVERIEADSTQASGSPGDWPAQQFELRRQLADMLGLEPMPERGDLRATVTGQSEQGDVVIENLHYQSSPGLYVTANLYRPQEVADPLPAVLYLCGHSDKRANGVSYGNKAGYEHHGMWYARNGFVCLVIDTVQLGEIRGEHHGTHRLGKWWWISRGYTPAGVEAWAGIRGLDYLETRPEVDRKRFGVAGRSGGGAYSWWVAALDERVACAVPTAGITSLRDHVVHGCVSGHCDCMFMVNDRRWDYGRVAALVAPRPLLICNTDKDPIFPIEGVHDIFRTVRETYRGLGAENNLGLHIAEGGHQNVQPLQTGEFHWMLRHLRGIKATDTFADPAVRSIPMEKLKVFTSLPADERNTSIDRTFVPAASWPVPDDAEDWSRQKSVMTRALRETVFAGGPEETIVTTHSGRSVADGIAAHRFVLSSDEPDLSPELDLFLIHGETVRPRELERIVLRILDRDGYERFREGMSGSFPELVRKGPAPAGAVGKLDGELDSVRGTKTGIVWFAPRGVGPTNRASAPKDEVHFRRRFYLIGETLEANQVTDIRRAMDSLKEITGGAAIPVELTAGTVQAVNALYASLLGEAPARLELRDLPASHMDAKAPPYLNILRHLDLPQAVALAAENSRVVLLGTSPEAWKYPVGLSRDLGWEKTGRGLEIRADP